MGLAGIDVERAAAGVAAHHTEARPLPGRDLSGLLTGKTAAAAIATPLYFMTEDDITRGLNETNLLTGKPFEPVEHPSNIESVIATLPTGDGGSPELWKLNHYYERLDEWNADHGIKPNPFAPPAAEPVYEMHNLTADPEERHNRVERRPRRPQPAPVCPRQRARRQAARTELAQPVTAGRCQLSRLDGASEPLRTGIESSALPGLRETDCLACPPGIPAPRSQPG